MSCKTTGSFYNEQVGGSFGNAIKWQRLRKRNKLAAASTTGKMAAAK
jgi:hypothetical protein